MNDTAYVIDIDRLVLTGTTGYRADHLRVLLEAEVQRVLSGAGIPEDVAAPSTETTVAGEVARFVAQAVRGGEA